MVVFSRRTALWAGVAGVAVATAVNLQSRALAATAPENLLRAVVTINGAVYDFREAQGRDVGDFVSTIGGFTQACIRTEVTGCPLTVFFRPDRTSDRAEVVFELGKIFNSAPAHLGAYTATIYRGTNVLATIDVPAHYWFSRWRWQSAIRPVVGDIEDLITTNLVPPYDRVGGLATVAQTQTTTTSSTTVSGNATTSCTTTTITPISLPDMDDLNLPAPLKVYPYTVMGLAGINPYMPATGERPDIGIVTEAQAEYICTSRQTALDQLRAQAEAAGTMPWHMRDENTGAAINLRAYPGATWYSSTAQGQPYVKNTKSPVTLDSAHQPAIAYVPYLLTGDPYHLEDLQYQANWNIGTLVPQYRMSIPQARIFAWNLRTLAQAARITPANVPSWVLPKQYFVDFLTEYRQFFERDYVNSARPERAIFRATTNIDNSRDEGATAPGGTWVDTWEDEFVTTIIGWVIAMGFPEWQKAFDWRISSTIARTSATSGWIRANATPYRVILRETKTSPMVTTWADAYALTERIAKITYVDRNTWSPADMTYLTYSRGSLVYISKLQAWNVTENLSWATGQLNARKWKTAYKWRLGGGLS